MPPFLTKRAPLFLGLFILTLLLGAYSNTVHGPFIFDDQGAILQNPSIRNLSDLGSVLNPPSATGVTVNGRPLVNLSLALNYHFSGAQPEAYHLTNIALHLATAFVLFLLLRHLITELRRGQEPQKVAASLPALVITGIWALHPLQTAAVSYTVQRAEILVSLCLCSTFYFFLRFNSASNASKPTQARLWGVLCFLACLAGMTAKEVMCAAPLLVLLLDRAVNNTGVFATFRRRPLFYSMLAATWLPLGYLVLQSGARGKTAGFSLGISALDYFTTQLYAVPHYLRLALWPDPLVFDYGGKVLITDPLLVLPGACVLLALAALGLWALWKQPLLGFSLAAFFGLLAPSSSLVPLADTMFEHRLYLPLAAILGAAALLLRTHWKASLLWAGVTLLPLLAFLTWQRNTVYGSERKLWEDVVAKNPANVRAHYTLGSLLFAAGEKDRAIAEYETALRLDPNDVGTRVNLGAALAQMGRHQEAVTHLQSALQQEPHSAFLHNNLANALVSLGRLREAVPHYEAALAADPNSAALHNNLGNLLAGLGEFPAAETQLRTAIRLDNRYPEAHANLANVLAQTARQEDALKHYTAALTFKPDFPDAWLNQATTLLRMGRLEEARASYKAVLRFQPNNATATEMLRRLGGKP